jgi:hypothetical protein
MDLERGRYGLLAPSAAGPTQPPAGRRGARLLVARQRCWTGCSAAERHPRGPRVSTLVAGGWETTGQLSRAADRRRRQSGRRHPPGHMCPTSTVRTAVVPEAADGQSADGSGSLQLPLLFLKAGQRAACGRPRPARCAHVGWGTVVNISELRRGLSRQIGNAARCPTLPWVPYCGTAIAVWIGSFGDSLSSTGSLFPLPAGLA